jgi:perosamine synthetase
MIRIIHAHGLRAVPVDIDPGTLAVWPWMLEAALTPRTRVVLVAHLFGGRMDLGGIARFAKDRGLLLVEDCAQAFQGPKRMGDAVADVTMYSFGTLKTSTALGGAVLRVRDREVLGRMRGIQASYPRRAGAVTRRSSSGY